MLIGVLYLFFVVGMHIFNLPAANLSAGSGSRAGFITGLLLLAIFFLLFLLPQSFPVFVLEMLVWGVAASYYWVAYHIFFTEVGQQKHFGEENGLLSALSILSGIVAPFLAGIILTISGFTSLFLASLSVTVLACLMSFFAKDRERPKSVGLKEVWQEFAKHRPFALASFGVGAEEMVASLAWPLFLYVVFKSYLDVGIITSLVALTAGVAALVTGKLSDRLPKEKIEAVGAPLVASSFVGKALLQVPLLLYFFDSVYKIADIVLGIPLVTLAYNQTVHGEKTKFLIFREYAIRLGEYSAIIFFIILVFLNLPFWWIFLIAAVFSFLPRAIRDSLPTPAV